MLPSEYANVISLPEPESRGKVVVAKDRGGPFKIAYQIYGTGDTHLVWVMGLNTPNIAWHRQTKYFGVERGNTYSSLVFDNRGVGDSDKPIMQYSTSEMARDLLELLENIGWVEEKRIHLIGVSMGGMIAMEFALLAPQLLASLTLQSTAAKLESKIPWYQQLIARIIMFLPKPFETRLLQAQRVLFSPEWLDAQDDLGEFATNRHRHVAEEHWRVVNLSPPVWVGGLLQGLACAWHYVSNDRLQKIGEVVNPETGIPLPVNVLTGTADKLIDHSHSHTIVAGINGAGGSERAKLKVFEGVGHVIHWEAKDEYNTLMEEHFQATEKALSR